jgi:asparagine synthase (glutamine-hydrolysing)
MDEPIADPAVIPAFNLAKYSRENGRIVMLSGMGGDEIDGGYSRHKILSKLNFYKYLKILKISPWLPKSFKRDFNRLFSFLEDPSPKNYFSLTAYFNANEIDDLLLNLTWRNNYNTKINSLLPVEGLSDLQKYFYLDYKGFLASHNLIYMDKASMAASVEVRVPLLDKNLVNYFFSTISEKASKFVYKPRLTQDLKKRLGKDYCHIKKQGFRFPTDEWMKDYVDWQDVKMELSPILNTNHISNLLAVVQHSPQLVSMKLFYIYTLYLWVKTFNVKLD